MVRLGYGNINGFPGNVIGNTKIPALRWWIWKHNLDAFFGAEGNLNWKCMPPEGRLPKFFRLENKLRMMAAYNTHEDFGQKQQGSTFSLAFGQLASKVKNVGTDNSGLGRWSWMQLKGCNGHIIRIIMAYQPCKSADTQLGTVWQQHHRYQDLQGRRQENPCQAFKMDLLDALHYWRHAGKQLVLFIDANEDTTRGPLNSALMGNNLQMREAVHSHHPSLPATPTFKSSGLLGRAPMDVAYLTPDLPLSTSTWISVKCCPGDHYFCILEIKWKALVGEDLFKIAHPEA